MPPKTRRQTRRGASTKARGRGRGRAIATEDTEKAEDIDASALSVVPEAAEHSANAQTQDESTELPISNDAGEDLHPTPTTHPPNHASQNVTSSTTLNLAEQGCHDLDGSGNHNVPLMESSGETSVIAEQADTLKQPPKRNLAQMLGDEQDQTIFNDTHKDREEKEGHPAAGLPSTEEQEKAENIIMSEEKTPDEARQHQPRHEHQHNEAQSNNGEKDDSRAAKLEEEISSLRATLEDVRRQQAEVLASLKPPHTPSSAQDTIKQHISLLHQYNDMRDIGTGLLGLIAENRGVRVRDVFEEFGLAEDD
ncbi:Swi5-domain-containing protein [Xylona heveae TC161]|uniref:Swi5-domain-containing protein n=1 Tax=Xylona heveae (strain CBS 132557 / TC161) TaxID=1328760 RepID=A0A165GT98_XYLHT|nr:Swi5-domain-containing protein [Xylona heveae TC161]KZF22570.1 Swi5-domain-containing protein [Xylona heveae TC161]